MKTIRRNKVWLGVVTGFVLLGLGILAWFLIPGLRKSPMDYLAASPQTTVAEYWPTNGWRIATPEEQGFDSVKLAEGLQTLQNKHIDSLLIIRNGYVILDATYFPYDGTFIHDLGSVTKSVTTTLIAIAAGQGKLQLDQPMLSYFPDRTIADLDSRKQSITVRNLTGMVNGMQSGCLSRDEPTLDAMRSQSDWIQAALDRKMARQPGSRFCYDSPGMHILSAILQKTTGLTEFEFAQQNLFNPLGIKDVYWKTDPQGYSHGWGDLWLKPPDAAKIGYLWLNHGMWDGKQIVPADWVADAVTVHAKTGQKENYGYGWWVSDNSYAAIGRGGQNIKVYPALNIIVVTTAGNFDYSVLDKILAAAFTGPEKPLPPNPKGMAQLDAILAEIQQGQAAQPATSLPETAKTISGKTYRCDSNAVGITSLRFEFSGLEVAELYVKRNGRDFTWDIGLDGKYRMAPEGLTRGEWEDSQTFDIQIFSIGTRTLRVSFNGDLLEGSIPEMNIKFKCQIQNL